MEFTVYAATWNVAGSTTVIEKSDIMQLLFGNLKDIEISQSEPDSNLVSLASPLNPSLRTSYSRTPFADIYCVAFQETVDLSTINVVFDDSKAIERSNYLTSLIEDAFKSKNLVYKRISMKHLVGMLILVFIKDEMSTFVQDVRETAIGVGVMGMMGNKGAVAVRFSLHDTSICFVASHFTANKKEVLSRNQDYHLILEKLVFKRQAYLSGVEEIVDYSEINAYDDYISTSTNMNKTWQDLRFFWDKDLKILDHSQIFWLGDLNYRIDDINYEDIIECVENNRIQPLLERDQLFAEKRKGNVFEGFEEGKINFLPTYKYQPGTTFYENRQGKKKREPAWCDRIMFLNRTEGQISLSNYDRVELLPSDHKPVVASFSIRCNKINLQNERDVFIEIVRLVDKWENDNAPKVEVVEKCINFPAVKYNVETSSNIQVINNGPSLARWRFLKKVVGDDNEIGLISKEWLKIEPSLGVLFPGENINVNISVLVNKFHVQNFKDKVDSLDDILVLHIENGCDFFISVTGNFEISTMNDYKSLEEENICAVDSTNLSESSHVPTFSPTLESNFDQIYQKVHANNVHKVTKIDTSGVFCVEDEILAARIRKAHENTEN